jgi:hypothetical protein
VIDAVASKSPLLGEPSTKSQKKYVPMFSCFKRTLLHALVREQTDIDFNDTQTFLELNKTYVQSLGPLGRWRTLLSLRSLKKIHRIEVVSLLCIIDTSSRSRRVSSEESTR